MAKVRWCGEIGAAADMIRKVMNANSGGIVIVSRSGIRDAAVTSERRDDVVVIAKCAAAAATCGYLEWQGAWIRAEALADGRHLI